MSNDLDLGQFADGEIRGASFSLAQIVFFALLVALGLAIGFVPGVAGWIEANPLFALPPFVVILCVVARLYPGITDGDMFDFD